MNDRNIIIGVVVFLLLVGALLFAVSPSSSTNSSTSASSSASSVASGENLPLAQCLKDKGAVFYGAFWCPHCRDQKALFGAAVPALPYVECSTPDGNGQTLVCREKKIETYPTWVFPGGTQVTGTQSLEALAEKSGCSTAFSGAVKATSSSETSSSSATAFPLK